MRRVLCLLFLCFQVLSMVACGETALSVSTVATTVPETQVESTETSVPSTEAAVTENVQPETVPLTTETEAVESESRFPYTMELPASAEIYYGPSRDSGYARSVALTAIYTIVDEAWDSNGNLWGKLKSGAGWVILEVNTNVGHPVCARCGTSQATSFYDDWEPGDRCMTCVREDFHFGEDGGIFCSQCYKDCSYMGVLEDGRCEFCHAKD